MALVKFDLESVVYVLGRGGVIQTVYVVFRADHKAKDTVEFAHREGIKMLIDRGADGYPVATQLVFAEPRSWEHLGGNDADPDSELPPEELLKMLFVCCIEMLRYHEGHLQKMGNELIQDAVAAIRRYPPERLVWHV